MPPLSPAHRDGCARLGIARLNAFRLGVYESVIGVTVDGVLVGGDAGTGLRIEGAAIQHVLNEATDTAAFRTRGFTPVAGQTIAVFDGEASTSHQIFGGRILEAALLYEQRTANIAHDIRCVDPTWLLGRRTVLTQYTNQSATTIVLDLIANFALGVTTDHVVAGLPVIDQISFLNDPLPACLTAICERIGASWYLDYADDLHVFLTETPDANAITDATPRGATDLMLSEDLSQVVTKVIGRGGGGKAAIDLPAGNAQLPVDTAVWYSDDGGLAEVGPQIIAYTGVRGRAADTGDLTAGALVGTGNAPAAPVAWLNSYSGAALSVGVYQWAASFVTAAGETKATGIATKTITHSAVLPMTVTPTAQTTGSGTSGATAGGTYRFRVAVIFQNGGAAISPVSAPYVVDAHFWEIYVGTPGYAGGSLSPWAKYYAELGQTFEAPAAYTNVYRTTNGGSTYYLVHQIVGIAPGPYLSAGSISLDDTTLVSQPVLPSAGTWNAAFLTDVPTGPTGVTARNIYRTTAGGSTLLYAGVISNNTGQTFSDILPDASLALAAPSTNTSGLTESESVLAGATEMPVTSTGPFDADGGAAGGWARVGNVSIRYTAISAGKLTGIPATGVGALTAPARYGTQITVQPRLVGVSGLDLAVKQGDVVTMRIEQTDTAARDVMAARLTPTGDTVDPEDGVIELVIGNSQFTETELRDYMAATLEDRKDPRLTLTFASRDPSLEVGRLVTVAVTEPPISGTFRIQRLTFAEIAVSGGRATVLPLRRIEASNKLYKFSDLLRRLRAVDGVR